MILEYSLVVFGIVMIIIVVKPLLNWSQFKQNVTDNLEMIRVKKEFEKKNK